MVIQLKVQSHHFPCLLAHWRGWETERSNIAVGITAPSISHEDMRLRISHWGDSLLSTTPGSKTGSAHANCYALMYIHTHTDIIHTHGEGQFIFLGSFYRFTFCFQKLQWVIAQRARESPKSCRFMLVRKEIDSTYSKQRSMWVW